MNEYASQGHIQGGGVFNFDSAWFLKRGNSDATLCVCATVQAPERERGPFSVCVCVCVWGGQSSSSQLERATAKTGRETGLSWIAGTTARATTLMHSKPHRSILIVDMYTEARNWYVEGPRDGAGDGSSAWTRVMCMACLQN